MPGRTAAANQLGFDRIGRIEIEATLSCRGRRDGGHARLVRGNQFVGEQLGTHHAYLAAAATGVAARADSRDARSATAMAAATSAIAALP